MRTHQTTNKRRNQPTLHGDNILRHEPDGGAHFPGNANGELGVLVAVVVGAAGVDEVVVDVGGLHAGEHIKEEDAVCERRVLEGAHLGALATLAGHVVGPFDHVCVGDFLLAEALGQALECRHNVLAHQLPDEAES